MNPVVLRIFGIVFAVAAAVLAILNLKRVADLGVFWLVPLFIVFSALFLVLSRVAGRRVKM